MEDRAAYLGASDMAAVLGVDRWRSPLDVYLEKIGEAPGTEETEAMYWGTTLEDKVAARFAELAGVKVRRKREAISHRELPFLGGHIDRKIVGRREGLEVKVSSADEWGEEGTDQIPAHYLPQVHTYMAITGYETWHVAALLWSFGPPRLRRYVVHRDRELEEILLEAAREFWDRVARREPPDPTSSGECARRWKASGRTIEATPDLLDTVTAIKDLKAERKELDTKIERLEFRLKTAMQDAVAVVDGAGNPVATWKEQTSSRVDVRRMRKEMEECELQKWMTTSTTRVLRIR